MSTIVLRTLSTGLSTGAATKNASLTLLEVDNNFNNLNATKLEKSANLSDVANPATARNNIGANNASNLTTGTIASGILGNSTLFVGSTPIPLNRTSGNLGLSGITSITMPGSTSGTVQLQPSAVAGTSVIVIPAISGTLYVSNGPDVALSDGGTGATLTPVSGGVVYSSSSAMAITPAGTAGQLLASNGAGAPTWVAPQSYVNVSTSTSNNTLYPLLVGATGTLATANIANTTNPISYNPSTGALTATTFVGSGAQLTNVDRFPAQLNNAGRYLTTDGTNVSWSPVAGVFTSVVRTTSYTASSFDYVFADTTAGALTITLPASPAQGSAVKVYDQGSNFSVNNVIVDRNGNTIEGQAANLTLSRSNIEFALIYLGTTWRVYTTAVQRTSSVGPVIAGTTIGAEGQQIVLLIENYQTTGSYTLTVTGGTFTRSRDLIYWTLPLVPTTTSHSITVVHATVGGTTTTTHQVQVINTVTVVDAPSVVVTNFNTAGSSTGWTYI